MTPVADADRTTQRSLAVVLRHLRETRGLSQRGLATAAGLANAYVTQIESGARGKRAGRDQILALANALRTTKAETIELLRAAGLDAGLDDDGRPTFEAFISGDPLLRADEKRALIASYRTYVRAGQ